jgi:hypothetical protein
MCLKYNIQHISTAAVVTPPITGLSCGCNDLNMPLSLLGARWLDQSQDDKLAETDRQEIVL